VEAVAAHLDLVPVVEQQPHGGDGVDRDLGVAALRREPLLGPVLEVRRDEQLAQDEQDDDRCGGEDQGASHVA